MQSKSLICDGQVRSALRRAASASNAPPGCTAGGCWDGVRAAREELTAAELRKNQSNFEPPLCCTSSYSVEIELPLQHQQEQPRFSSLLLPRAGAGVCQNAVKQS